MANPDIPSALGVLQTHLAAAGAALTRPILDVTRGVPTGAGIRFYWGGEVPPPKMPSRVLTGDIVGQRFNIAALWPASNLSPDLVAVLDADMQTLAGEVRTRIDGDSTLGGFVTDLTLGDATADIVLISNTRFVALRWDLDLSYVEYTIAP